jgi:hypothetical protein
MKTSHLLILIVAAFVAGILFWPTLYRYDKMTVGGGTFPVRTNRVTGYTEFFRGGEWVPERGSERARKGRPLPPQELLKLTGNANLGYGGFVGKIYNGSPWVVTRVVFRVVAKEKEGSVRWSRALSDNIAVQPLSTASFFISVTGDSEIGSFEWSIEDAEGNPP